MDHSDVISVKLSEEYYFSTTPKRKIMRTITLRSKTSTLKNVIFLNIKKIRSIVYGVLLQVFHYTAITAPFL